MHRVMRFGFALPAVTAAIAVVSLAGCNNVLDTAPSDRVLASQEIVDQASAEAALNGAYDALQSSGAYGLDVELLGDLPSDNDVAVGTYQFLKNVNNNQIASDNPEVTDMWEALYTQIDRDNVILEKVPTVASIPDDAKAEITGEAYLLRALSYHNLVKFWGGVPMPLVPVKVAQDASKYTRASVADVYTQILSDLDNAEQRISSTDVFRANAMAVPAVRARVLFYRASTPGANAAADYQAALDAANEVLAGRDTLTVPYPDLFSASGTETDEDIMRVSFNESEENSLGYYYLYEGRFEAAPTPDLADAYEPGDLRKDWSVAFRPGSSTKYQGTKFPTTIGTESPHVIRLAELVLIKAEVLARQNDLAGAVAEYNKVRVRAGLAPHVLGVDVTTQSDALAAIEKERRLELAFEGDRWPDLVRLGQAQQVRGFTKAGYVLFPIPLRDITTTPGLTQNPDY
jgi:starch-binding outer membrane protein, SusD/RagB family